MGRLVKPQCYVLFVRRTYHFRWRTYDLSHPTMFAVIAFIIFAGCRSLSRDIGVPMGNEVQGPTSPFVNSCPAGTGFELDSRSPAFGNATGHQNSRFHSLSVSTSLLGKLLFVLWSSGLSPKGLDISFLLIFRFGRYPLVVALYPSHYRVKHACGGYNSKPEGSPTSLSSRGRNFP